MTCSEYHGGKLTEIRIGNRPFFTNSILLLNHLWSLSFQVFDGKTFIYSRENLFPPEFESYLQNLFPEMEGLTVEQEVYGKNQMPVG